MIDESQLGGKKTLKKTVSRRQQKKTEKKRINITCGEEDETAYTTISTWPFMYSFWSPLTQFWLLRNYALFHNEF